MEKTKKRSGISADRAYRIKEKLRARIVDIYNTARVFHHTHEAILESMKRDVWDAPELARAPSWVRSMLHETQRCLGDENWRLLTWMLSVDGALLTSKEVDALTAKEKAEGLDKAKDYRSPWSRVDSERSRHVWTGKDGSPIRDRPYGAVKGE